MKGKVSKVSSRDFHSVQLWSFQLEGSERWYRTGKIEPDFEEGQWIEFEETNGLVVPGSVVVVVEESAEVVSETAAATSVTGTTDVSATAPLEQAERRVYRGGTAMSLDVGDRIRYQAARADATRIVVAALHCDHLPHSASTAKGKRLDLLVGYVQEITKELLRQEEEA